MASASYVGALGPMGLYGRIATLWNGGADQLKFPADQLKRHGCVHFTKETCVCSFKMSKKWSFGPIRNDARPIVAAGFSRMLSTDVLNHVACCKTLNFVLRVIYCWYHFLDLFKCKSAHVLACCQSVKQRWYKSKEKPFLRLTCESLLRRSCDLLILVFHLFMTSAMLYPVSVACYKIDK